MFHVKHSTSSSGSLRCSSRKIERQNLIAPQQRSDLWNRHILDGAQLSAWPDGEGSWCDIGSGAGLPGLVIAILGGRPMTLIEPRRLRADFLRRAVAELGLRTGVGRGAQGRASWRANSTSSPPARWPGSTSCSAWRVIWPTARRNGCFPRVNRRNRNWMRRARTWQGSFRLVPSRTHPAAAIVVAEHVQRRGKR